MLKKLRIRNFKCFNDFSLDLKELTILTGSNSAGKSTVIQSILLSDSAYKDYEKRIYINDVYGINLGIASKLLSREGLSTKETEDIGDQIIFSYEPPHVEVILKVKDIAEENYFEKEIQGNWDNNLFYLNAERIGPRIANQITNNSISNVGFHGENTGFVLSRLQNESLSIPEKLKIGKSSLFPSICMDWLNVIIPNSDFSSESISDLGVSALRYNKDSVPTAVGFGLSYVLPIIVQALYCVSLSKEKNKKVVFIVENPEAHLHPYSQSQIGKFLSKIAMHGVQVITETHSEHVINGARLQLAEGQNTDLMGLFFFDAGKAEEISINKFGELSHWPAGFFDQSMKDTRKILENRRGGV